MEYQSDIFNIFDKDENFRVIMRRLLEASFLESFNGIMITSAEPGYPILYVNPAFCNMTGYGPQELVGKSPDVLQGEATDPAVLQRLREEISRGEVFHGQAINYRKDGSTFLMDWKIVPIRSAGEEITHYLAIQQRVG
ncbi:MAG: PAS domain-containing protein [Desulfosarcinaceae bacterium]|nr:PAS domain-containing protein [Desulfosarcinaceae bacterium]